ncbi:MAG TPA: RNA degradosome polyphosphate kinase [Streptosporangiaceae bacterium]|nr:RNA degradosome polyphosphate kinase [Streptosporangiaceae bacterium]
MESGRNGSGREAGATTRRPRDSERAAAEQEAAERARQHAQAATRARARAAERDRRRAERPAGTATAVAERDSTARPGAPEVSETAGELPPGRYLDREESWLRFDQRVLELAEDPEIPLLERVRFESIFASGMDEFFMVRVAGRIRRMATGLPVEMASGKPSDEILQITFDMARDLMARHARVYAEMLQPALAESGIEILRWKELTDPEQASIHQLFKERIYPVLTPLVVDPSHPFPYISNLSLSLAVMIADPATGATLFARVKVPPLLPRFLRVGPNRFVPLEDVIAAHLGDLFVGMDVLEHHAFRITRIRDLEIDEDVTENLLQSLEKELMRRRFEPAVRIEVEESMSEDVLDRLVTELGVDERAVYRLPGPLDLSGLSAIADLDMRHLKYPTFVPSESALPHDRSVFAAMRERDILVHHPYDSFTASTQRLVVSAAADPTVLAIKQTLYRTSGDSEIVDALIDAAEAGKQVVVVVEIKARGDERANIAWARKLEEAGCHVVYGFVGLKTHCKMALVVREQPDGSLRRYCHIGTGNYHPKTARLYEDFGLLTADPTVGEDITDLFNHLTGYSRPPDYRRLLVAPAGVRAGLIEQIEAQAELARAGQPARIQLKCNSLIDEAMIDTLYRASNDGVPTDLWVRGICALRPGLKGMSENIRVRSIVGRFLEHSRIYAFGTGEPDAPGDVWIGSADLMHRNLDRRVELLIRVTDPGQRADLRGLINLAMDPGTAAWWLAGDGTYTRHHLDADGHPLNDLQDVLIRARQGRAADG